MCDNCWNAEKFADKIKNRDLCDGQEMMTMSFETLTYNLTQEWVQSNKSEFFIFRKAINDLPESSEIALPVSSKDMSGNFKSGQINIHFI
ncbi:MAG: hypothetical protein K9M07_00420 [Simkaniaceae bacterium]|nr:hypothetical protein [Simkaniaceae bacterium]